MDMFISDPRRSLNELKQRNCSLYCFVQHVRTCTRSLPIVKGMHTGFLRGEGYTVGSLPGVLSYNALTNSFKYNGFREFVSLDVLSQARGKR